MNSLAIDTSNKTLTVAVTTTEGKNYEIVIPNTLQHSVTLVPYIEEVLQSASCSIANIDRIVIAKGPGSYTGLRVGVTVAKTLAYALNKELVEVSSLAVLAANILKTGTAYDIIPFFDARREHIFTGIYAISQNQLVLVEDERYIAWEEWLLYLKQREKQYYFVGEVSQDLRQHIIEVLGENTLFAEEDEQIPHATCLNQLGVTMPIVDSALAIPTYLKLAEAEENWRNQQGQVDEVDYVERM